VLAVGTIEPRKDYPLLVRSFSAVAAAHPDVALVIVGSEGWGAQRFAESVDASPVRDRIVRPGYLDDAALAATLRGASVLAYPSRYEGFGFPPLQAMAAGVPVVATAGGAVPEVVGDGAWLVEIGDGDALSEQLVRALAGGEDVAALVARGRERSAGFTWDRCAEGLAGLYRDAAGRRGDGRPVGR
jgi:glycosyltransferase involved in cell wall biosynthesis